MARSGGRFGCIPQLGSYEQVQKSLRWLRFRSWALCCGRGFDCFGSSRSGQRRSWFGSGRPLWRRIGTGWQKLVPWAGGKDGEDEVEGEEDGDNVRVYLRFENQTDAAVEVFWFSHTGEVTRFYSLNAGCSITQETFKGNVWLVKEVPRKENPPGSGSVDEDRPTDSGQKAASDKLPKRDKGGEEAAQVSGNASRESEHQEKSGSDKHGRLLVRVKVVTDVVQRQLCLITPRPAESGPVDPSIDDHPIPDDNIPACYARVYETDLGIPIVARSSSVPMLALREAANVIRHMLEGCPSYILKKLRKHRCKVAIIARHEVTTDVLEHSHLRGTPVPDGRDWDKQVRGLGGTLLIPTCSVGEENVLRSRDDRFGKESILVHEFAHTIMEIGFSKQLHQRIKDIFQQSKGLYDSDIYMVSDEKEYWAEGSESWFDASLRSDVNGGINSREKIRVHDPALAELLEEVYGDGNWRYDFTPLDGS